MRRAWSGVRRGAVGGVLGGVGLAVVLLLGGCAAAAGSAGAGASASASAGASGGAGAGGGASASGSAVVVPAAAGSKGAWDAGAGAIVLGSGEHRLDLYVDAMCPYCARFDTDHGAAIARWVGSGATRVVIHPMNFLDRASLGSGYSTRAATVLAEVARERPDAVLPVLAALFRDQPDEGTRGLDDDRLAAIAAEHGVDVAGALADRPFDAVLDAANEASFRVIDATPTLVVDGRVASGSLTGAALEQAVDRMVGIAG